jgi:NAD(P)-dependent dehydrogenase (short-subunit alcohol dehydrogenase family)/rhamnose utilization protein RhaD (predicted bifunctional aldolase and dehydrogenase)
MKAEIKDLIEISHHYGNNKDFVIAGGGNTSYKDSKHIWIKASGAKLADIGEDGFAVLSREKLREIGTKEYSDNSLERERQVKEDLFRCSIYPERGLRPSVETSLHELLSYAYIVHLHSTVINGLLCSRNAFKLTHELFGDEVLFVPYTDPGYTLFKKLESEIALYRLAHQVDPQVIFLQNHGVFVGACGIQNIIETYDGLIAKINTRITKHLEIIPQPCNEKLVEILPAIRMQLSDQSLKVLRCRNTSLAAHFSKSSAEFHKISLPFTPDMIVYCKSKFLYIEQSDAPESILKSFAMQLERFEKEYGYLPKVIIIKNWGIIAAEDSVQAAEIVLDVFEDLMKISWYSDFFGGHRFMMPEEISFIDEWEVENYRRQVSKAGIAGKLFNKIALVTGGAMGFGAGISAQLMREKANVMVADINIDAGQSLVKELTSAQASNIISFIQADVSSSASVEQMVNRTVLEFGGLDLLISNAGILKAGSLEEMEPEVFEKITQVNYTGFFLCARSASAVMKLQNKYRPDYFTDIIQINSKSGLRGSNKNFAYAGAKFGGIGLVQSFAMELAPYRIKVNAICPGNFFEGPLWSDPQKGLFVQYLKAGKVPEAKTIEDVRKFYEEQVPLKRGCMVEDVMKALIYLVEQQYETGQALPVTGGQVMLR